MASTPQQLQHNSNIAPQHMFDSVTLADHGLTATNSLHSIAMRAPSPTASSSVAVDRHLEAPQQYEDLLSANTRLKTRVSELEVINELFRGRVTELEQSDATSRRSEMIARDSETRLQRSLEDAYRREEGLKHRVADLERQVVNHNGFRNGNQQQSEPLTKKMRVDDMVEHSPNKYEPEKVA